MNGENDAFAALAQRHETQAYAIAYAILMNHTDAQEVAHMAFIRAFSRLSQLRTPDRFPAWLARITRTCAADLRRRGPRETAMGAPRDYADAPGTVIAQEEFEAVEDARIVVERGLKTLPESLRVPLTMRYMSDSDYREIAVALSISVDAAQKRVSNALRRMREFFQRTGLEEDGLDILRTRCLAFPVGLSVAPGVMEALPAKPRTKYAPQGVSQWVSYAFTGCLFSVGLMGFLASSQDSSDERVGVAGYGGFNFDAKETSRRFGAGVFNDPPIIRALARPGDELLGWKVWDATRDPTPVLLSREHFRSPPMSAVVNNEIGVYRQFDPVHGTIAVQVWLKPAPGSSLLYLFLMLDGERGYEKGVGVYKQEHSQWWHYGNPNGVTYEEMIRENGAPIPGMATDRWVPLAPVNNAGQVIKIVHRTFEGKYDVYIDGELLKRDIYLPGTVGKPFDGLWINSGNPLNGGLPSYFDDLSVTVVDPPRARWRDNSDQKQLTAR